MTEPTEITVENKLVTEKRAINVYHHATQGVHIISHRGSITLPLKSAETDDYLHVSALRGPGRLWSNCILDVPSWIDFEFEPEGKVTVTVTHKGNRTLLKIPPGLPTWQLKITRPVKQLPGDSSPGSNDRVIIGEVNG